MYKKTKNHEEDTMYFFIIYSYFYNSECFPINQEVLGGYLGLCRASINRHIQKMLDLGYLRVVDTYFYNAVKGIKHWKNNIYTLDREGMNKYLIDNFNMDCLDNIAEEEARFWDFWGYKEKFYATQEELAKIAEDERRETLLIAHYAEKYKDFLDLMDNLNNDTKRVIKMKYLGQGRKRLTSPLCATKNPEKHKDTARENLLKKQYGKSPVEEFDVNASIYRLSYNLGHGKPLSHDIDLYQMIYEACGWDKPWNKKVRTMFKDLLMPAYMKECALKYRTYLYERRQRYYASCSKTDKEFVNQCEQIEAFFGDKLDNIFERVRIALHKVLNLKSFCQAEIFIYESNLHLIMLTKFKNMGIIASNVYDGFYMPKGVLTQAEFEKIYDEATKILKVNLRKKIKKLEEGV